MGKPERQEAREQFYADLAVKHDADPRVIAKGFRVLQEDKQHHGNFTTALAYITRAERELALVARDNPGHELDAELVDEIILAGESRLFADTGSVVPQ